MNVEVLVLVLIVMQAVTVGLVYFITRMRNPQPSDFPEWIKPLVPLIFTALLAAASKTETEEDDRLVMLWKQAIESWLGGDKPTPPPPLTYKETSGVAATTRPQAGQPRPSV